eukprot:3164981-Prymnesium_polylepis.1
MPARGRGRSTVAKAGGARAASRNRQVARTNHATRGPCAAGRAAAAARPSRSCWSQPHDSAAECHPWASCKPQRATPRAALAAQPPRLAPRRATLHQAQPTRALPRRCHPTNPARRENVGGRL